MNNNTDIILWYLFHSFKQWLVVYKSHRYNISLMYYTLIQYEHCLWNWSSNYYYMSLLAIHSWLISHTLTRTIYLLNWQSYTLLIIKTIVENATTWYLYAPEPFSNLWILFLNMNFVWDRMLANNNNIYHPYFFQN